MSKSNCMLNRHFRGMMPIMPTVVTESGGLDTGSQKRVIDYCIDSGAVAIGHFGIASEFHKLSDEDRRVLTNLIVDHVAGRVPVFIGITAPSDRIMVDYAREAESLGADLLMVSLPYVYLPDGSGAYRLFESLRRVTDTPIIIQDTPATSPILTPELIMRIVNELGGIQSVKAEGANFIAKTARLLELTDGKLQVIGGAGGKHLLHLLRIGVTAFMTGTEAVDIHGSVVQAYLEGDEEQAADIYYRQLLPYFMFYTDYSEELLKAMLHLRGIIDCPHVIPPRRDLPMSEVEWQELRWVLERIGYARGWGDDR